MTPRRVNLHSNGSYLCTVTEEDNCGVCGINVDRFQLYKIVQRISTCRQSSHMHRLKHKFRMRDTAPSPARPCPAKPRHLLGTIST